MLSSLPLWHWTLVYNEDLKPKNKEIRKDPLGAFKWKTMQPPTPLHFKSYVDHLHI